MTNTNPASQSDLEFLKNKLTNLKSPEPKPIQNQPQQIMSTSQDQFVNIEQEISVVQPKTVIQKTPDAENGMQNLSLQIAQAMKFFCKIKAD
jgi:hypothetical protein